MAVRDLNREVISGLRQAMRVLGTEGNKARFARMLKEFAGDAPGETTVGRWLRDDDLVPAWALLAAARAARMSIDKLIEDGFAVDKLTKRGLTEQIRELTQSEDPAQQDQA